MLAAVAPAVTSNAYTQLFGSPSIDARLNLSLDDLIKERKKETKKESKGNKREPIKQSQTSSTKKADAKQKKTKAAANAQSDKRQEKVNKNRGLLVAQPTKKRQNNKENNKTNARGKSSEKLPRKKGKQAIAVPAGRNVTGPKAKPLQQRHKNLHAQGKNAMKNGNISRSQKGKMPQLNSTHKKTPMHSPKQQVKKTMTFVVKTTKKGRAVNTTTKGKNLQITVVQSKAALRQTKPQKPLNKKHTNAKAAKALLPGKSQPKTRKVLAQTIVKKAKTASRKQWTSANGKFIVRKPVVVRKA